jgi:hypothetical protein
MFQGSDRATVHVIKLIYVYFSSSRSTAWLRIAPGAVSYCAAITGAAKAADAKGAEIL